MVTMKKRIARANTIVDYDDLLFLETLNKKEKNGFISLHIDALKNKMNMSYNAFLTHYKRLSSYEFIKIILPMDKTARFRGEKIHFVELTTEGSSFLNAIKNTPTIKTFFEDYKKKYV